MKNVRELPARPRIQHYEEQAKELQRAFRSGAAEVIPLIRRYHIRLRGRPNTNDRNSVTDSEVLRAKLSLADAQEIIARTHQFEDWPQFVEHIRALNQKGSQVAQFEGAVDAIVSGEVAPLKRLLRENPELIRARSTREHRATLLHYAAANGVEGYRQKTPKNAVRIATILLEAGADVEADAEMYGGGATTLGLLATSVHPE